MAAPVPHNLTGLSDQAAFRQLRQRCASFLRGRAYRIVSTAAIAVGQASGRLREAIVARQMCMHGEARRCKKCHGDARIFGN
jgi:hypothetical protein